METSDCRAAAEYVTPVTVPGLAEHTFQLSVLHEVYKALMGHP